MIWVLIVLVLLAFFDLNRANQQVSYWRRRRNKSRADWERFKRLHPGRDDLEKQKDEANAQQSDGEPGS